VADIWFSLGDVHQQQGKVDSAIDDFRQALRLQSNWAEVNVRLAELYKRAGRRSDALQYYQNALRLDPENVETRTKLGVLLAEQGQISQAIEQWREALRVQPDYARAHHNLGVALAQLGRHEEALQSLTQALALKPDYAEACFNLGIVLTNLRKPDEALARYRQAIRLKPDYADAYQNLGALLTDIGRPAEAALYVRQAIRLRPDHAESHSQLGLALAGQGEYPDAEAAYHEALRLEPQNADFHSNLGNAFQEQGRLPEALTCYELALCFNPASASTRWNRALMLLQSGNYEEGWKEYEWRWKRKQTPPRPFDQPRWDGAPLDGRTILIYMEQGLGDMIQFIRYASLVKERGARVVVECPPFLLSLFSHYPGIDRLLAEGETLPEFDVQAPLMSLPMLLETRLTNVPADMPYLFADPLLVEKWKMELDRGQRTEDRGQRSVKIGIVWQGNSHHRLDRWRSIPLRQFAMLSELRGARLISLQHGAGREQLAKYPIALDLGDDLDRGAGGFMGTAAVMKNLDLVISVDTAAAHLAGALGVPVWVPLSAMGEWRWLLDRDDTPWYPTMRLFRQSKLGAWEPVFERIAAAIENCQQIASSPSQDSRDREGVSVGGR
jgi:tetratricopeptide (TPR) repeat protein